MINDFRQQRGTRRRDGMEAEKKDEGAIKNKLGASKEGVIKGRKDGNDVSSTAF